MSKGLGNWPEQDKLHEDHKGSTIYVLDLLTADPDRIWQPLTARFLVCPNCGMAYNSQADTLSGYAMEWMAAAEGDTFVLFCTCGRLFPQEDWLADVHITEGVKR